MKKIAFIILMVGVFTLKVKAPEKSEKFSGPQYWTHGRDMVFYIYPEDYHSRKIEEILNDTNTIK